MEYIFIINPKSGTETLQKSVRKIIKQLKAQYAVEVLETKGSDDAKRFAQTIDRGQLLVAVGGDGTVNEVINGLYHNDYQIPLAIVPAGTVNDFAYYFKLPNQEAKIHAYLTRYNTVAVDLGMANKRLFANVIAAGYVADIGFEVNKKSKKWLGKMAYYLKGFYAALKNLNRSNRFELVIDGACEQYDAYMFIALNSSSLGGLSYFAPHATCTDGYLDLYIIKKTGLIGGIFLLSRLLTGRLIADQHVVYKQVKSVTVMSDSSIVSDIDGEIGDYLPLHIDLIEGAIQLAVPVKP